MLPLGTCKKLLGLGHGFSDSQIEELRDQMYLIADVLVGSALGDERFLKEFEHHANEKVQNDAGEDFEERAAIIEFESKKPRKEAERLAIMQIERNHEK